MSAACITLGYTARMRRYSPAAERNQEPILAVLRSVLPRSGRVLELAAGTGQHAVYFARHFPELRWQPTDIDAAALESINAWREQIGPENLCAPLQLDVVAPWPISDADAIICCNLLHIAPWNVCEALFRGAAAILAAGLPVVLYGPFLLDDTPTAPSNLAFDAQLRARNAAWGIRALKDVKAVADEAGFDYEDLVAMPANNFTVIFRRRE